MINGHRHSPLAPSQAAPRRSETCSFCFPSLPHTPPVPSEGVPPPSLPNWCSWGATTAQSGVCGGNNGRWLSPWGFAVKDWKAPKVLPGDLLVFQWVGEVHSVHKVDVADYTACTFLNAKQLARSRNYGKYIYKVVPKDYGNTIYFSSKANSDCSDGIKASFVVGS
ncbi:unnamed protein product [Closterium sp. NIES-64]|nr:unnamed protein product [Closterium sp. NIES-64]